MSHFKRVQHLCIYRYLGIHPRMDIALQNWSVPCKGWWALSVRYMGKTPPNLKGLANGFSGTIFEEKMTNRRLKNLSNSCWVSMNVQCQGCNTRSHQVRVETTNCSITELVVIPWRFQKKVSHQPKTFTCFFWGGAGPFSKRNNNSAFYINH